MENGSKMPSPKLLERIADDVRRKERSLAVVIAIFVFFGLAIFTLAFLANTVGGRLFFPR